MDMPEEASGDGDIEILDTRGAASTSTPKMVSFSGSPYGSADAYGGQKYGDDYTDWHSQCEFACRECGKVFRQPATLQNHIKTQHNMDSDSYKFKHGVRTLMTNEVSRKNLGSLKELKLSPRPNKGSLVPLLVSEVKSDLGYETSGWFN